MHKIMRVCASLVVVLAGLGMQKEAWSSDLAAATTTPSYALPTASTTMAVSSLHRPGDAPNSTDYVMEPPGQRGDCEQRHLYQSLEEKIYLHQIFGRAPLRAINLD